MKKYKRLLKIARKKINEKHKGAAGFETVIVMPVVFIMLMLSLLFFFTMMTYVSYNNMANTVAQHLDMRATGYKATNGITLSSTVTNGKHYNVDGKNVVNGSSIKTYGLSGGTGSGTDEVLLGGLNAAINAIAENKSGNQLNMPFTAIKCITALNDQPVNLTSSKKNAGNTIKVIIEYYPISMFGSKKADGTEGPFGSVTMKAVGYATIS